MGSTSFLGFSYSNLLLVFLNLLFLGTCIIFSRKFEDFVWVFFIYRYFSVPYFGLSIVTTEIRFHTTQCYCNPEH